MAEPIASATPWTSLVTGGAAGIGAATARKLASRGINVLIADVDANGAEKLASEIKATYKVDAFHLRVDVRREEDVTNMVKAVVERWGRLDYAANVAGIYPDLGERVDETNVTHETFDRTYEINQRGVWLCQRAEASQMATQAPRAVAFSPAASRTVTPQRGSIVNVSSTAALTGLGVPAYSASKAAVIAITRNGAYFYSKHGVRCNAISPGPTITPMVATFFPDAVRPSIADNSPALAPTVPLQRNAWPEEVANVISFLLSDESSFVTGVNLPIDGGVSNATISKM